MSFIWFDYISQQNACQSAFTFKNPDIENPRSIQIDKPKNTAYSLGMTKSQAIKLLGSAVALAQALHVSRQAVHQWPEQLTPRMADRVQAYLYRQAKKAAK